MASGKNYAVFALIFIVAASLIFLNGCGSNQEQKYNSPPTYEDGMKELFSWFSSSSTSSSQKSCVDECQADSCSGPDFTECILAGDGCKHPIFRGEVSGKCSTQTKQSTPTQTPTPQPQPTQPKIVITAQDVEMQFRRSTLFSQLPADTAATLGFYNSRGDTTYKFFVSGGGKTVLYAGQTVDLELYILDEWFVKIKNYPTFCGGIKDLVKSGEFRLELIDFFGTIAKYGHLMNCA